MYLSSPQYMPHASTISFSILSPNNQVKVIPPPAPVTSSVGKFRVEFQASTIYNNPASRSIGYLHLNLEVAGFKSRPDIGCYEAFSDQSQSFEANAKMENQTRLKPLPSRSLAIHVSLTVHSFHNAAVSHSLSVF